VWNADGIEVGSEDLAAWNAAVVSLQRTRGESRQKLTLSPASKVVQVQHLQPVGSIYALAGLAALRWDEH